MDLSFLSRFMSLSMRKRYSSDKAYHPFPGPEEMVKFERSGNGYRGRYVAWDLAFQAVQTILGSSTVLLLSCSGEASPKVWMKIPAPDCAEIYHYRQGSPLRVLGKIKNIQDDNIYLDECEIEFFDPPEVDG